MKECQIIVFALIGMPTNTRSDAFHDSKECLPYRYTRHLHDSCKASPQVLEGISTTLGRHYYKRTPHFAMSG